MKTITECLGENVKRLRTERGLTQEGFAKQASLSISFIQNIEHGKKWVGPKTISVLARTLKVSESELFRDCDSPSVPDPKEVLLTLAKALGIHLTEAHLAQVKTRNPLSFYSSLYESMPDDLCLELMKKCKEPGWSWAAVRKAASK